jgi:hypothetical protein
MRHRDSDEMDFIERYRAKMKAKNRNRRARIYQR